MYIVGVTGAKDLIDGDDGMFFAKFRSSYLRPFLLPEFHGVVPIFLPQIESMIPEYVKLCHGLLLTGGDVDVPCSLYSGCEAEREGEAEFADKTGRVKFDLELVKAFEASKKPILGVCLGMQIIACAKGCELNKNVGAIMKVPHFRKNSYDDASFLMHEVRIVRETKLFNLIQNDIIKTNSAHHCCVGKISGEVIASAFTERDNIVEAIEVKNHPFMMGVQWHPEAIFEDKAQQSLFRAFAFALKS
jgi:putative glutamine amidotransferase